MRMIRHKYHYGLVDIPEHGPVTGSKSLTGRTLPALKNDGDTIREEFGGFLSYMVNVRDAIQLIKLIDIVGVNLSGVLNDWIEVPKNHYVVGAYIHGRYYVLLRNGTIMTHPYVQKSRVENQNNVVWLNREKT